MMKLINTIKIYNCDIVQSQMVFGVISYIFYEKIWIDAVSWHVMKSCHLN